MNGGIGVLIKYVVVIVHIGALAVYSKAELENAHSFHIQVLGSEVGKAHVNLLYCTTQVLGSVIECCPIATNVATYCYPYYSSSLSPATALLSTRPSLDGDATRSSSIPLLPDTNASPG